MKPWCLTILAALVFVVAPAQAQTKPSRPHVVLFLADDLGVDFVGCYGNAAIRTPNIDGLARDGMRFTRVFAGSPTCSPSRAVLYTGLYPARNGLRGNHTQCRPDVRSLPSYLGGLGYRVVLMNKVHVGPPRVFEFEYHKAALPMNPKVPRKYRGEGLDTSAVARLIGDHARDKAGQPLCLVLADSGPHVLWEPNRDYDPARLPLAPYLVDTPKTRTALANYYQDITTVDRHVGEVLAAIKENGLAENILFVFTSDQGPEWPRCKWTLYDAGLRVPFIARWPGKVAPGAVTDALVSLVDVTPTLIDLAGGEAAAGLDGKSFKDVLLGGQRTFRDRVFASHTGDGEMNRFPQRGVRDQRYKYILNLHPDRRWTTHFTLVDGLPDSHKDVYDSWVAKARMDPATARWIAHLERHPAEELYDTETDPHELRNVAGAPAHAPVLARLRQELKEWRKAQGDTDD